MTFAVSRDCKKTKTRDERRSSSTEEIFGEKNGKRKKHEQSQSYNPSRGLHFTQTYVIKHKDVKIRCSMKFSREFNFAGTKFREHFTTGYKFSQISGNFLSGI